MSVVYTRVQLSTRIRISHLDNDDDSIVIDDEIMMPTQLLLQKNMKPKKKNKQEKVPRTFRLLNFAPQMFSVLYWTIVVSVFVLNVFQS